jgi:hypothetical protein
MRTSILTAALVSTALVGPAQAAASPIAHPRGADAIVIRVSTGGGFVAPSAMLGSVPSFTLYGDGTVIVPRVVRQVYPGAAMPPLLQVRLPEARVQAVLVRARRAGLLAPRAIDYGNMGAVGVSDAPTTTVRLDAAGRGVVRAAYALGITAGHGRMTAAQMQARLALTRFLDGLPRVRGGTPYVPHAIAVFVGRYNGQAAPGRNTVTWPLPVELAGTPPPNGVGYRCLVVRGTAARTLRTTLKRANQDTRWVVRGAPAAAYGLILRPLLPDERSCASFTR